MGLLVWFRAGGPVVGVNVAITRNTAAHHRDE